MPSVTWPPPRTAANFHATTTDARGFVLADGFSVAFPQLVDRTSVDSGPAKQKRVSVSRPDAVSVRYLMTTFDRNWFEDFYKGISGGQGGAIWFNWTHPVTGAAVLARFLGDSPPKYEPYKPDWLISVTLEVRPA